MEWIPENRMRVALLVRCQASSKLDLAEKLQTKVTMLNQVKRWFGGRDAVANLHEDQVSIGEPLDQEFDAVRQTQMIDPSQLHAARE